MELKIKGKDRLEDIITVLLCLGRSEQNLAGLSRFQFWRLSKVEKDILTSLKDEGLLSKP